MKISVRIPNCDIYLTNAMGSPELKSVPVALAINIGSVVELLERTRHLIDAGSTPRFVVFTNAAVAVVDQDMRLGRQYIVGVVVGDGEVVDALVVGGLVFGGGDLDVGAGAGAEPHAGLEVGGLHPLADVAGDPEGVVGRGNDDTASVGVVGGLIQEGATWVRRVAQRQEGACAVGVDGDLNEILLTLARDGGQHGFGGGFTCFGVGRQHFIADLEVLDCLFGAT